MSVSSESGGEPGIRLGVGSLKSALNQPEAIVACERSSAGTELHRLDPKTLSVWLDAYRPGDLWRTGKLGANP